MTSMHYLRPNILGDLRAEVDSQMLQYAFYETADYRTLIETTDRTIIVGRRGTGKSALSIQLEKYWKGANSTEIIRLTPEEHQTIGIRPQIALFGDSFRLVRAGSRVAWRYALMMEIARHLRPRSRFRRSDGYIQMEKKIIEWSGFGRNIYDRFYGLLKDKLDRKEDPESRVGNFARKTDIDSVEKFLIAYCSSLNVTVVIIVDGLDEGYEPDDLGIGLIDGLIQSIVDLKTRVPAVRPLVFLRDNIFRSIQVFDPDYSRTIEGTTLRLHWDTESLFHFAAKRLKIAFDIDKEVTRRIWNTCTSGELKGKDGFEKCLYLTLYRPRDLLSLLNQSFYIAGTQGQSILALEHVERSGQDISENRFLDLQKEYEAILPGLSSYVTIFRSQAPECSTKEILDKISILLESGSENPVIQQEFLLLSEPSAVLRTLYSVGFLGARNKHTGNYVFCHDGRSPDKAVSEAEEFLVHPCYWMALNCTRRILDRNEAEQIFDEYDIEVSSETPEIRNEKIRALIRDLESIEENRENSLKFEEWCHQAIRICFARGLRNVELKPNKSATTRRDIVATNLGDGDAWRRIYEDYDSRQIIFEVKNYSNIESSDYHQITSYLSGEYGRLGFIVTRDDSMELRSDRDVGWIRDIYSQHQKFIVKLTARFLVRLLDKLRKPQKHDSVDRALHKLLDDYARLYVFGQKGQKTPKRRITRARRKQR